MSAITCKAVYENGVFRPVQPLGGIPEHACVDVVIHVPEQQPAPTASASAPPRVLGLNRGKLVHISDDFDASLPDDFWFGEDWLARTGKP